MMASVVWLSVHGRKCLSTIVPANRISLRGDQYELLIDFNSDIQVYRDHQTDRPICQGFFQYHAKQAEGSHHDDKIHEGFDVNKTQSTFIKPNISSNILC